jgi:hypothetical protein
VPGRRLRGAPPPVSRAPPERAATLKPVKKSSPLPGGSPSVPMR